MGHNIEATTTPFKSFYKIILPCILTENKLRIPEDFVKVYENELSSHAILKVPNGQDFRIQLEKSEKRLWFRKGWKEFAEHHSIRCGFFLVFNYEGSSNFKVNIFDLTATEIEYPKTLGSHEKAKNRSKSSVSRTRGRKKASPVSSQDMIFNECSLRGVNRKRCLHSVLPSIFEFAPEFAMRINNYQKCIMKSFLDRSRSNGRYQTRNKRRKLGKSGDGTSKAVVVYNSSIRYESEELFPKNRASLDESSGIFNESERRNDTHSADKNVKQFAEDMQLVTPSEKDEHPVKVKQEEGEELIGMSDYNILSTRSMVQGKESAVYAALTLKLNNPYFMSILKKQNVDLSCILNVPAYFGNKYLSSNTHYLKLAGPDGRRLEVSCFSNGKVQYLSRGWVTFVKEYKLVEHDVCVFELIQVDDEVLNVHIFRSH